MIKTSDMIYLETLNENYRCLTIQSFKEDILFGITLEYNPYYFVSWLTGYSDDDLKTL